MRHTRGVFASSCFLAGLAGGLSLLTALAQNPSFAGREFRRVWTDGTIPEGVTTGVSVTEAYLSKAGVYFKADFTPKGFYYVDDSGARTVASKEQDAFKKTAVWAFMGILNDQDLLFCPGTFGNEYPCYIYSGTGPSAVTEPTPEQALGQYVEDRMVYTTIEGLSGAHMYLYQKGEPAELLLDRDMLAGFNGHLDYDGESVVLTAGQVDFDIVVWLRLQDGTLKRIIGHGDPLPGSTGTYRGLPTQQVTFVDQGRVFMVAESRETLPVFNDRVMFASDGNTTEVLFKSRQEIPGQPGVTIEGFDVADVQDGRIWVVASHSGGVKTLFLVENGAWTRIASSTDSYDGRTPVSLRAFRYGARGDDLVFQVSFLGVNFRLINELYTNASLPGFTVVGPVTAAPVQIAAAPDNQWRFTTPAEPGKLHTLESSTTLKSWAAAAAAILAEEAQELEWLLPRTDGAVFFRVKVETP